METILIVLVVVALAAVAVFLYRNPQLLGKAEQGARIKADEALKNMSTAIQREKDAVKQIAAKLPAQRERVANIQARVDSTQRELDTAVTERDGLKTKYESMKGRVSEQALGKIAEDYSAAKKTVATLEATLVEAKNDANEAEETLNDFTAELERAEANITTDEARTELAALKRESAAFRNEVKGMKSSLSTIGESRKEIENELDVARRLDDLSKGTKEDREIAKAEKDLAAEQARKELEGDLAADKGGSKN